MFVIVNISFSWKLYILKLKVEWYEYDNVAKFSIYMVHTFIIIIYNNKAYKNS